jgi:hypothetical protein
MGNPLRNKSRLFHSIPHDRPPLSTPKVNEPLHSGGVFVFKTHLLGAHAARFVGVWRKVKRHSVTAVHGPAFRQLKRLPH